MLASATQQQSSGLNSTPTPAAGAATCASSATTKDAKNLNGVFFLMSIMSRLLFKLWALKQ